MSAKLLSSLFFSFHGAFCRQRSGWSWEKVGLLPSHHNCCERRSMPFRLSPTHTLKKHFLSLFCVIDALHSAFLPCRCRDSLIATVEVGPSTCLRHAVSSVLQVFVLVVTASLLAAGAWGCSLIRQEFDPVLFLPPDSYLRHFVSAHETQFPRDGWDAEVYVAGDHSLDDLRRLDHVVDVMEQWAGNGTVIKGKGKKKPLLH